MLLGPANDLNGIIVPRGQLWGTAVFEHPDGSPEVGGTRYSSVAGDADVS
jgi:hypothetical protein